MYLQHTWVLLLAIAGAITVSSGARRIETIYYNDSRLVVASPMAVRLINRTNTTAFSIVGTNEDDCTQKDPTGKFVVTNPTRGYMQIPFTVTGGVYRFTGQFYSIDSLSNSMFMQFNSGSRKTWNMAISGPAPLLMPLAADTVGSTLLEECYIFASGTHNVRLFVREPGSSMLSLIVDELPVASVARIVDGCAPCEWNRENIFTLELNDFCGPPMFHAGLVLVNGQPCKVLQHVSQDTVRCTTPAIAPLLEMENVTLRLNVMYTNGTVSTWMLSRLATSLMFVYPMPQTSGNNLPLIIGLSAGLGFLVLSALLVVCCSCCNSGRNNGKAPKDKSQPFTLVFTDIQSSTSLWSLATEVMGHALEEHHQLVRELIAKYSGYEVKSLGDSFMIAFHSADQAVSLAVELQKLFLAHDWGSNTIDAAYRDVEAQHLEGGTLPYTECELTLSLSAEDYNRCWSGLRVRVGVHTGFGDIKYDEVTKGYDYYGNVPNIAARVESAAHGGQVIITGDTLKALGEHSLMISPLGYVPLRGVMDPVPLYEVETIVGRHFPPLRLEVANSFEEDNKMDLDVPVDDETRSCSSLAANEHIAMCVQVVEAVFSAVPMPEREESLRKLCRKWHLTFPRSANCDVMAQALGRRAAPIVQRKRSTAVPRRSLSGHSTIQKYVDIAHHGDMAG